MLLTSDRSTKPFKFSPLRARTINQYSHIQGRLEATRCGAHDKIEDTWESLGNLKHMEPRILENFLAKHDIAQELAAKKAEIARDQRLATAQAEVKAARTRASLTGVNGPAPLLLLDQLRGNASPGGSAWRFAIDHPPLGHLLLLLRRTAARSLSPLTAPCTCRQCHREGTSV